MHSLRHLLFICSTLLFTLNAMPAHARVALVIGEPFGSFGTVMPQGHAGIYLADLCVETPVQLRPCRSGEFGAVVSRYHDLRHPTLDWMAFPLPIFLYGTADPAEIPPFITPEIEAGLRARYREQHLNEILPARPDRHGVVHPPPYGDWDEGIGAAFDRRLLLYSFDTSSAQDAAMLPGSTPALTGGPTPSRATTAQTLPPICCVSPCPRS